MFRPTSLLRLILCALALSYAACPSSALAPGEGPEACANGIDDNADGKIDCLDPKCIVLDACTFGERCNNGIDDNANQLVDCADPQCEGQGCGAGCLCVGGQAVFFVGDAGPIKRTDAGQGGGTGTGTDGGRIDAGAGGGTGAADSGTGGGTGATDSGTGGGGGTSGFDAGSGCTGCYAGCTCVGTTKIETACADGADNDGDSVTDCADPDCGGVSCGSGCQCAGLVKKEISCSDGTDNDGDSLVDCADPDCNASGTEICNDGVDNTCDGKIDCADPKCFGVPTLCSQLNDGMPCGIDGQCGGGRCFTEGVTGYPNGFCTNSTACVVSNNAGCNGGLCVTVGGANICRPKCTGAGTGPSGTCRAGYACIDSDTNATNDNNTCMPFCTTDAECGTAGGSLGCNLWSRRCENKAKGLKSYGEACGADAECEGLLCIRDTPSGYCSGPCRNDARACAATVEGSFCNVLPNTGDNVSQCLRRCSLFTECRNSDRYGCFRFSAFQNFGSDGGACQCLPAGYGIAGHPEQCCSNSSSGGACN